MMKTLKEHNEDRWGSLEEFGKPCLNGIECPECGEELWDSEPSMMLLSNPPQKNVHCENCDYRGCRLA